MVWAGVLLIVLLVASGAYLTDPARLRRQALAALQALPFEDVDVAHVAFSPLRGLQLRDLVISADVRSDPPTDRGRDLPPLLHIAQLDIDCDLLALLRGRLEPKAIHAQDVTASLLCDPESSSGNWELVSANIDEDHAARLAALLSGDLPRITISQADVQLMVLERGRAHLFQRVRVRLDGQSTALGYGVRVYRLPVTSGPVGELQWMQAGGELQIGLDRIELDAVRRVLPPRFVKFIERAGLGTRVRVDRLVYRLGVAGDGAAGTLPGQAAPGLTAVELRLEDLRCAIPLEQDEVGSGSAAGPRRPADCFLQLADATATLTYQRDERGTPGRLRVQAEGPLNDAPATLTLTTAAEIVPRLWRRAVSGAAESSPRAAPGLEDVVHAELRLRGFDVPTTRTAPAFLRSPRLPSSIRSAFENYQPRGKIDLCVRVLPDGPGGAGTTASGDLARIEVIIDGRGSRCRYYQFPYEFHDVQGRVRLSEGRVHFENLCGRHGAGWACMEGLVNSTKSWTGFDLTFRGRNIALEQDLYAALPAKYQRLWQDAAPVGLCEIAAHVGRPDGTPETGAADAGVHIDAQILSGSLSLGAGRRIDHADGRLLIHDGMIEVQGLHGYDRDTAVLLDGRVTADSQRACADLRVELADLPIEHQARLDVGAEQSGPALHFAGRADVWGRVYGPDPNDVRGEHYAVEIKDGQLHGQNPTHRWSNSRGWVVARNAARELLSFETSRGEARLTAVGQLPQTGSGAQPLSLDLRADVPAINELLGQFVPRDWADVAQQLGLAGPGTMTVQLRPGAGGGAGGQTARIQVQADQMRAQSLPLDLRNMRADLTLAPERFELHSGTAEWGSRGAIAVDAAGTWGGRALDVKSCVTGRALRFCPELVTALPAPLQRLLERLSLEGDFDALLSEVRLRGPADARSWHLAGRVPLREARMQLGLELSELEGELSGTCMVGPDGEVELDAQLDIHGGLVAGRAIADWTGRLARVAGERWVRLADMQGRLCDGAAIAAVAIDPTTGEYELTLTINDVSVAALFPSPDQAPDKPGRVDGKISLQGEADDVASRRGSGDLRIRGASLLQTPILKSVAEARSSEDPAISDTVDQVDIRFLWEGSLWRLLRIEVQSRDLRLVGEGTWNLHDDTIELTLLGAHPEHWPRVAVLSDVVESVGQELMRYEVSGPRSSPTVTTRPLYKLDDALRALLGER